MTAAATSVGTAHCSLLAAGPAALPQAFPRGACMQALGGAVLQPGVECRPLHRVRLTICWHVAQPAGSGRRRRGHGAVGSCGHAGHMLWPACGAAAPRGCTPATAAAAADLSAPPRKLDRRRRRRRGGSVGGADGSWERRPAARAVPPHHQLAAPRHRWLACHDAPPAPPAHPARRLRRQQRRMAPSGVRRRGSFQPAQPAVPGARCRLAVAHGLCAQPGDAPGLAGALGAFRARL